MRILLKGSVIALALVGTTFATTGTSSADGVSISTSNHGRDRTNVGFSFDTSNVSSAYRDGYWDNDRRWHRWRNDREHRDYRDQHRDNYTDGYHNGDHTNVGVSFDFGNVAFGYQDGYWDNGHRWHKWRNRDEHDNYRSHYGDNYRDGDHRRYDGQGWRRD